MPPPPHSRPNVPGASFETMRLSEKTIELNYCAQATEIFSSLGRSVIWFGLTQKQEAQAGFDAATRIGGRLLLLQFKASSHNVMIPGPLGGLARRFRAKHDQMVRLRQQC